MFSRPKASHHIGSPTLEGRDAPRVKTPVHGGNSARSCSCTLSRPVSLLGDRFFQQFASAKFVLPSSANAVLRKNLTDSPARFELIRTLKPFCTRTRTCPSSTRKPMTSLVLFNENTAKHGSLKNNSLTSKVN